MTPHPIVTGLATGDFWEGMLIGIAMGVLASAVAVVLTVLAI